MKGSIYLCPKPEASETEMKEGGEQTSEFDPDSNSVIEKWLTDLNGLSQG